MSFFENPLRGFTGRASLTSGAFVIALLLGSIAGLTTSAVHASSTVAPAPSVSKLQKELRSALVAKQTNTALGVVDQLADIGSKKAMDAIVGLAFRADAPDVERGTILRLRELPRESEAIERLSELVTKHKDYRVRAGLLWVMEARHEPAAMTAVVQSLYDRMPSVVLAALEVLAKKDQLNTVEHLIAALENQEEQGRRDALLAFEIRKTLTSITNLNFEYAADWQNYWRVHGEEFQRPPKKERGEKATSVKRDPPRFFGIEVNTDRLVFVLDVSGSMERKDPLPEEDGSEAGKRGGTSVGPKKVKPKPTQDEIPESRRRLTRVKKELITVINRLPKETMFNIITFNHLIGEFEKKLVRATPNNKKKAIAFINEFKPEGQTHTDDALAKAFEFEQIDTIFLLSDGAPRRNDKLMETKPILDTVRTWNRFRRVRINAVTFEQCGANLRRFMRLLASKNNGGYKELR
ncbi:MAG: VWA domain-containing protein [Planctomycetota bacterium]